MSSGTELELHAKEKIFGKHSVRGVFIARPQEIDSVLLAGKEDYHGDIIELAAKHNIPYEFTTWPNFKQQGEFTEDDKHQGVLAFVRPRRIYNEDDFDELQDAKCVLMLDQITNPQNFATIIRSAAFFGADAIMFMKNRAVDISPTVTRYAVGGAEFVKFFQITNVSQSLEDLKRMGFWTYGFDERGSDPLNQCNFAEKSVLVVGAEGQGLRKKTKSYCDFLVSITGGVNGVESLNAGTATSIALYEFFRAKAAQ